MNRKVTFKEFFERELERAIPEESKLADCFGDMIILGELKFNAKDITHDDVRDTVIQALNKAVEKLMEKEVELPELYG